ncbi:MAG: outer membrane beta-barrel domain-containing protein [Myxococcota bacterium]
MTTPSPLAQRSVVTLLSALLLATAPAAAQTDEAPPAAGEGEGAGIADETATTKPASEELKGSIRVIQRRRVLRRHRLELQGFGGIGVADTMFRHFRASGAMRFHFDEHWSIGGSYAHYWADESSQFDDVTDNYELFPERAAMEWMAGGNLAYTPIFGKFALFGSNIVHFDLSTMVGGGVLESTRSDDLRWTITVGFGWRVFFNDWLAWTSEVKDHIYVEKFNAGDEVVNHVVFQTGLSIFFPFDFEYRFPR